LPQVVLPINLRTQQATDQTPLQHFGKSVLGVPVSSAARAGELVFMSGTPAFDTAGELAIGDFPAQMKQAMDDVTAVLKSAGAGGLPCSIEEGGAQQPIHPPLTVGRFESLMKHPGKQGRAPCRFAGNHERDFAPISREQITACLFSAPASYSVCFRAKVGN
jgi:hypothetical protein